MDVYGQMCDGTSISVDENDFPQTCISTAADDGAASSATFDYEAGYAANGMDDIRVTMTATCAAAATTTGDANVTSVAACLGPNGLNTSTAANTDPFTLNAAGGSDMGYVSINDDPCASCIVEVCYELINGFESDANGLDIDWSSMNGGTEGQESFVGWIEGTNNTTGAALPSYNSGVLVDGSYCFAETSTGITAGQHLTGTAAGGALPAGAFGADEITGNPPAGMAGDGQATTCADDWGEGAGEPFNNDSGPNSTVSTGMGDAVIPPNWGFGTDDITVTKVCMVYFGSNNNAEDCGADNISEVNTSPSGSFSSVDFCLPPVEVECGTCTEGTAGLVITELSYDPSGTQGNDGDCEYIEIFNSYSNTITTDANTTIALSGGTTATLPAGTTIAPGEYIILTGPNFGGCTWATPPPAGTQIIDAGVAGDLSNAGEDVTITLACAVDASVDFTQTVTFSDALTPNAGGGGSAVYYPLDGTGPVEGAPTPGSGNCAGCAMTEFACTVTAVCMIDPPVVSNLVCSDNNTPDDPTDDTYTFDVLVNGMNTDAAASNTFNDDQTNMGIAYGTTLSYGSFPISGGDIIITYTDVDDPMCTATVTAPAPAPCSVPVCDISNIVLTQVCTGNAEEYELCVSFDYANIGAAGQFVIYTDTTAGTFIGPFNYADYDAAIAGGATCYTVPGFLGDASDLEVGVEFCVSDADAPAPGTGLPPGTPPPPSGLPDFACPQIYGILHNACAPAGGDEGPNEFVVIVNGDDPLLVSSIDVDTPGGSDYDDFNTTTAPASWTCPCCTYLDETGTIPADAVVVVTSAANVSTLDFTSLCNAAGTIYVLQDDGVGATGHFSNSGPRATLLNLAGTASCDGTTSYSYTNADGNDGDYTTFVGPDNPGVTVAGSTLGTPDPGNINSTGECTPQIVPASEVECYACATLDEVSCGACPIPVGPNDDSSVICDGNLGTTYTDWQAVVEAANPLDATQDPNGWGTVVYSGSTIPAGGVPDPVFVDGIHNGIDPCNPILQEAFAYLLCDQGNADPTDDTYALLGAFDLTIHLPATATPPADPGCGITLDHSCTATNDAGYTVEYSTDGGTTYSTTPPMLMPGDADVTVTYLVSVVGITDGSCTTTGTYALTCPVATTPQITITKDDADNSDDTQEADANGDATFTITITNTGTEDLCNIQLTDLPSDPTLAGATCAPTFASIDTDNGAAAAGSGDGQLLVGETETYICTIAGATADYVNTIAVVADGCTSGTVVMDDDPTNVTIAAPVCAITGLTATPGACNPADDTYSVVIDFTVADPGASGMYTVDLCGTAYGPFDYANLPETITGLVSDGANCDVVVTDVDNAGGAGGVYISSVLADPATNDTNGSGTVDSCDEYIVLTNSSASPVDVSGWEVYDLTGPRYVIPAGTSIPAGGSLTISTSDISGSIDGCTGIWNNGGDDIVLYSDAGITVVDMQTYGGVVDDEIVTFADPNGAGGAACSATAAYTAPVSCAVVACPTVTPVVDAASVCNADLGTEVVDWKALVGADFADPDGTNGPTAGVLYSGVPIGDAAFPSAEPTGVYGGDNCASDVQTWYAYYECDGDLNGTADSFIDAGSYTLTIYADAQEPSITVTQGDPVCTYLVVGVCGDETVDVLPDEACGTPAIADISVNVTTADGCTTAFTLIKPACNACGAVCAITGLIATPGACNPADDTYSVDIDFTVTDPGASGMYTVDVCGTTYGPFDYANLPETITGLASDGANCDVVVTDVDNSGGGVGGTIVPAAGDAVYVSFVPDGTGAGGGIDECAGESVTIHNFATDAAGDCVSVDISGFTLADNNGDFYTIPAGTIIPPGGTYTVTIDMVNNCSGTVGGGDGGGAQFANGGDNADLVDAGGVIINTTGNIDGDPGVEYESPELTAAGGAGSSGCSGGAACSAMTAYTAPATCALVACPTVTPVVSSAGVCDGDIFDINDWKNILGVDFADPDGTNGPTAGLLYSSVPIGDAAFPSAEPSGVYSGDNCVTDIQNWYAYYECDTDGDGTADSFVDAGSFELSLYPAPQMPSIQVTQGDPVCTYLVVGVCGDEVVDALPDEACGTPAADVSVNVITLNGCSAVFTLSKPACNACGLVCPDLTYQAAASSICSGDTVRITNTGTCDFTGTGSPLDSGPGTGTYPVFTVDISSNPVPNPIDFSDLTIGGFIANNPQSLFAIGDPCGDFLDIPANTTCDPLYYHVTAVVLDTDDPATPVGELGLMSDGCASQTFTIELYPQPGAPALDLGTCQYVLTNSCPDDVITITGGNGTGTTGAPATYDILPHSPAPNDTLFIDVNNGNCTSEFFFIPTEPTGPTLTCPAASCGVDATLSADLAPFSIDFGTLQFDFILDAFPGENFVDVIGASGAVVATFGPLAGAEGSTVTVTVDVPLSECPVSVDFIDTFGDGMQDSCFGDTDGMDGSFTVTDLASGAVLLGQTFPVGDGACGTATTTVESYTLTGCATYAYTLATTGVWSGPGVTDNGDGTATFNQSDDGTYTATYTYTSDIGCEFVETCDIVIDNCSGCAEYTNVGCVCIERACESNSLYVVDPAEDCTDELPAILAAPSDWVYEWYLDGVLVNTVVGQPYYSPSVIGNYTVVIYDPLTCESWDTACNSGFAVNEIIDCTDCD